MTNRMIYMIGYPGSGKTTAMHYALNETTCTVEGEPFAHTVYKNGLIQLGYEREVHGGTDSLSFNVQPRVIEWLPTVSDATIVGEGDRLANNSFFKAVQGQGRRLTIIHLDVGDLVAMRRATRRGSKFNTSWLRRTMTKVDNLASQWRGNIVTIKGNRGQKVVAQAVAEVIFNE